MSGLIRELVFPPATTLASHFRNLAANQYLSNFLLHRGISRKSPHLGRPEQWLWSQEKRVPFLVLHLILSLASYSILQAGPVCSSVTRMVIPGCLPYRIIERGECDSVKVQWTVMPNRMSATDQFHSAAGQLCDPEKSQKLL